MKTISFKSKNHVTPVNVNVPTEKAECDILSDAQLLRLIEEGARAWTYRGAAKSKWSGKTVAIEVVAAELLAIKPKGAKTGATLAKAQMLVVKDKAIKWLVRVTAECQAARAAMPEDKRLPLSVLGRDAFIQFIREREERFSFEFEPDGEFEPIDDKLEDAAGGAERENDARFQLTSECVLSFFTQMEEAMNALD